MKSCADIQRDISLLASEGSGCEDRLGTGQIARHIATCDRCARHFQEMQKLCGGLRSAAERMPEAAITPGFRRRLMESVSENEPAWFCIKPAWAALVPAAACLFLVFTLWNHSTERKDFPSASGLVVSVKGRPASQEGFPDGGIVSDADDGISEMDLEAYRRHLGRQDNGTIL
jgi:hypothetical protein